MVKWVRTLLSPGCLRRSRPETLLADVESPLPHIPIRSRSISYVHFPTLVAYDCLTAACVALVLSRWAGGAGLIAVSLLGKQENVSAITFGTALRSLPLDNRWRWSLNRSVGIFRYCCESFFFVVLGKYTKLRIIIKI